MRRLVCAGCGRESDDRAARWRAHQSDNVEIGQRPDIAVFCPVCAAFEFGNRR
jgi:hypothetical protein